MFDHLTDIGNGLLAIGTSPELEKNTLLREKVIDFVNAVGVHVQTAYADVHSVLSEVAYISASNATEADIRGLQKKLADSFIRDPIARLGTVCHQLDVLAQSFSTDIQPHLGVVKDREHLDWLFWVLTNSRHNFMVGVTTAIKSVVGLLDGCDGPDGLREARVRARSAQEELRNGLDKVNKARFQLVGSLPEGTNSLLSVESIADKVLRASPWFTGAFYLATSVVLLTALTIVASNVSAVALPIVVGAAFAGLVLVGVLQLRNDNKLSEHGFLTLVDLALRRVLLPISRKR